MAGPKLVWRSDGGGQLWADAGEHTVSVNRLLPASEARFVLWAANHGPPLASGTRSSTTEAMVAAEQMLARLAGRDDDPADRQAADE